MLVLSISLLLNLEQAEVVHSAESARQQAESSHLYRMRSNHLYTCASQAQRSGHSGSASSSSSSSSYTAAA
jgi:hypothetical protein